MKISVITRHYVINYGSLLQTIATQTAILKLGHEAEIIDYVRYDEHFSRVEKANIKLKPQYNNNFLKKFLYLLVRGPETIYAGKKFLKERLKYLKLSKNYQFFDELKNDTPIADVYLTGSDQVWGPMAAGEYDKAYFLNFIECKKKISYAASFGRIGNDISLNIKSNFKKWLNDYKTILVREKSAKDICDNLLIHSELVLDPTLLLTADEWKEILDIKESIIKEDYVLIYQVHNDKKLDKYAKKFSKEKNYKLIRISPFFHQIIRGGKFILCPSISNFVNILSNAKCLITDSFHGTAFAINFNVPFIEIMPNNNTGTRNKSILELCHLTDRILIDDSVMMDMNVDYSIANEYLRIERINSFKKLKDAIEK